MFRLIGCCIVNAYTCSDQIVFCRKCVVLKVQIPSSFAETILHLSLSQCLVYLLNFSFDALLGTITTVILKIRFWLVYRGLPVSCHLQDIFQNDFTKTNLKASAITKVQFRAGDVCSFDCRFVNSRWIFHWKNMLLSRLFDSWGTC